MGASADLAFLAGDVLDVAPRLLGAHLTHGGVTVRITEVEAYAGPADPASHAFRGRTRRTTTMFGPPGHLYVYLSHGIHRCCNVVCGPDGEASAVLLRAGEVVAGQAEAHAHRGPVPTPRLARGPGNLCRALGIELDHDGCDLSAGPVVLEPGAGEADQVHARGPRVGVSSAAERPWRFWIEGDPTVSAYRRGRVKESEPRP